ncbi:MAG: hypothetical protein ACYDCD_03640 [Candidatus Acidiferrales bacterium]
MKKRLAISIAAVIFLALLGWYVWAPSRTPSGQARMIVLSANNLQQFRADFNRNPLSARLVLLVSPT